MKNTSSVTSFSLVFISVILLFYILYIGASFIIPFVIALLISSIIISMASFFEKKWVNKIISFVFSLVIFSFIFFLIWFIINSNVKEMINNSGLYQDRLRELAYPIFNHFSWFQIDVNSLKEKTLGAVQISSVLWWVVSAITSIVGYLGIIFFYVIFILLESRFISKKIKIILWKVNWKDKIIEIIDHIKKDVKSYFVIKTIISFVTSILSYIILVSLWVDFALFWALLIFIFNFIPTIGSIIAVIFPLFFAFIQFGFTFSFSVVLIWLSAIQIIMGNFIEPRFMGNKLNLSPLVIIIALWFWGIIWWIVGMILSVPIMVIINIILSNIKETKPLAILMSEKWEIKTDFWIIEKQKYKLFNKIKNTFLKKK